MLAGAGDELQGMKKGITEIAHAIVITKADGENIKNANAAKATYQQALHIQQPVNSKWTPKVLTASAHTGSGIDDVWKLILAYEEQATHSGFFQHNRGLQNMEWFQNHFQYLLQLDFKGFKVLQTEKKKLESQTPEAKDNSETCR